MSEFEAGRERERRNAEVISEAVNSLDAYDSERAKRENQDLEDTGEEHIVISLPDRALTFFGSFHTNDPESKTVKSLRADIRDFMVSVPVEKMIFMIEGRHGGIDQKSAVRDMEALREKLGKEELVSVEEAVAEDGESGVALWVVAEYARQGLHVEITSPEIPEEIVIEKLKSDGFNENELAAYLALRDLTSVVGRDRPPKKTAETEAEKVEAEKKEEQDRVERLKNLTGTFYHYQEMTDVKWIKDVRTHEEYLNMNLQERSKYELLVAEEFLAGLNAWLRAEGHTSVDIASDVHALLDRDFNKISMVDINELSDPLDTAGRKSRVNMVSARWNGERDKYLVEAIGKAMAQGKRPYVIYGASHATHSEPALKKLTKIK